MLPIENSILNSVCGTFVRIAFVTDLNTTLVRDFERNYRETAQKIRALVEPLTDEQIWTRPYPYGNTIGHLLLHVTGNLMAQG